MNKGKLLASTVLVSAAAVMAASGASAKVKISGSAEHWVGYGENKKSINDVQNEFDVKSDAEIHFSFGSKLKNGMKLSGKMEMEANVGMDSTTVTNGGGLKDSVFDEGSMTLSGSFGKLTLGNNDVAAAHVGSIKVVGPVGIIKSDAGDWVKGSYEHNNLDSDLGAGDSQAIIFFTPKIGGLQFGMSYTPDNSDAVDSDYDDTETSGPHNWISGVVKYSGKAGKSKVGLGLGYTMNEATDSGSNADGEAYGIAASIANGPYSITMGYAHESVGGASNDDSFLGAGIKYKMGKGATMSIGYGRGVEDNDTGDDTSSSVTTIGYEKSLGGGVSWGSSLAWAEIDQSGAANDQNGIMIVTGIKAKF